jgi:hypothetical protein
MRHIRLDSGRAWKSVNVTEWRREEGGRRNECEGLLVQQRSEADDGRPRSIYSRINKENRLREIDVYSLRGRGLWVMVAESGGMLNPRRSSGL